MSKQRVPTGTEKTAQAVIFYRVKSMLWPESVFNLLTLAVLQKPLGVVTSKVRGIWTPNRILQL